MFMVILTPWQCNPTSVSVAHRVVSYVLTDVSVFTKNEWRTKQWQKKKFF